MPPSSFGDLIGQTMGLISRAFFSLGAMLAFLFETFLRVSPLPDEVDFLLVCLFVVLVIMFIGRLFRGK